MLRKWSLGFSILLLLQGCSNGGGNDFVVGGGGDTAAYQSLGAKMTPAAPYPEPAPDPAGRYQHPGDAKFVSPEKSPLSTFSIDVDTGSYANMRRSLVAGSLPPKESIRIEELVNYFPYEYPDPPKNQPFSVTTELSNCPWNPEHHLLKVGLQGRRIPADQIPARNLVFLVDTSGSMQSPERLPLLKESLTRLAATLTGKDHVAIVAYAGEAGVVLPPTPGSEREKIFAAIEALGAGGSTNGAAGIEQAYALAAENLDPKAENRVLLATDGDFNVGVSSTNGLVSLIEEKRQSGIFLTTLGFGANNDHVMEQLADKGNGNYAVIDSLDEAEKVLVREANANLITVAKDVKIQVEFNPQTVDEYRLIGYDNRVLAAEDFNDDAKDAGEVGAGHRVTALYEVELKQAGARPAVDPLRYAPQKKKASTDEVACVKLRYQEPKGSKSRLLSSIVTRDQLVPLARSSDDFRWTAAVAGFGMVLRGSEDRGTASLESVRELAQGARGQDREGYRSQFLQLVEAAEKAH